MTTIKNVLIEKLSQRDALRDRSKQVNIGPSEIGGCATRLWHKINGTEQTNFDTLKLSAIMGTAIHTAIEAVFTGEGYETEVELEHNGILGHVDLIDTTNNVIWDWKTTTKGSLAWFPSYQQREQVQIYGYLANANGYEIKQVGLVAIARDGNEEDIVEYVEDYNERVALNALARLDLIAQEYDAPAPEKEPSFCAKYCNYFGACTGKVDSSVNEIIENEEIISLIKQYKDLSDLNKSLDKQLSAAKEALVGTTGTTPDGTEIKWTSVAGRQTIDEQAVLSELGYVPKKQGSGYDRLSIR